MSFLIKTAIILAILYGVLVFGAWRLQRHLMYFPDPVHTPPDVFGLSGVEEVSFETPDGARVLSWWAPAKRGQRTILYFHGNAGTLATRGERVRKYQAEGYGIFMMTYRGYGGSTGAPSERANVQDAKQAYDLLGEKGIAPQNIVVYGESLGSGVATQVAAAREVAGLILDAPYTTMVDVAHEHYPYLPARWFMTDRYLTTKFIGKINAPLLIVHGEDDAVIPVKMGRALYDMANGPKELATFPGAGHADHHAFGSYEKIWNWLARLGQGRQIKAAE